MRTDVVNTRVPGVSRLMEPLIVIVILTLVYLFFAPVMKGGFIWDDEFNLLNNPNFRGLSGDHLAWMFSTFHDGNYHPLCWISLGLDFVLWGLNPAGYHFTNLVLHGLNAVLCFYLIAALLRCTDRGATAGTVAIFIGAAGGALFFALHPLRVETVAWIAARGDTVCGFFYFLTLLAYLRIDNGKDSDYKSKWLWVSLLCMTCSLLSRAWGITLPVVLLVMDWYPLGRLNLARPWVKGNRRILAEKIPYALLASVFAILAVLAKQSSMVAIARHSLADRLLQSFYGLCFYVWKSLVPLDLSPLYGLTRFDTSAPGNVLCVLMISAATIGLLLFTRRCPWALAAWSCYVIIISPQLGLVQSGPQAAADRYSYFACLPFAVIMGGGIAELGRKPGNWKRAAGLVVCAGLLLVLGTLSYRQTAVWRDELSFWDRVIALDAQNDVGVNMRARLKFEVLGDLIGAEADYSRALGLDPGNVTALVNRGLVRLGLEKFEGAATDFESAARLKEKRPEVYNGIGLLHYRQGRPQQALQAYDKAIRLSPDFVDSYINRALLYKDRGNPAAALADLNNAIRLDPESAEAYANRGALHQAQNENVPAARDYRTALRFAPENWPFRQKVVQNLLRVTAQQATRE